MLRNEHIFHETCNCIASHKDFQVPQQQQKPKEKPKNIFQRTKDKKMESANRENTFHLIASNMNSQHYAEEERKIVVCKNTQTKQEDEREKGIVHIKRTIGELIENAVTVHFTKG